jgi:hypothetical protein
MRLANCTDDDSESGEDQSSLLGGSDWIKLDLSVISINAKVISINAEAASPRRDG